MSFCGVASNLDYESSVTLSRLMGKEALSNNPMSDQRISGEGWSSPIINFVCEGDGVLHADNSEAILFKLPFVITNRVLDAAVFAGLHQIRVRCQQEEASGFEAFQRTAGFQIETGFEQIHLH